MSTCRICGASRRGVALGGAAMTLLGVTASVEPRFGLRCADDHPDRDVLVALQRAIDAQLTLARGRLLGLSRCGSCDGGLDLPQRVTLRSITVVPTDTTPFTIDLELPVTRCGECATDNVVAGLGRAVRRAASAAIAGAQATGLADG
jgi:hypothetical protein